MTPLIFPESIQSPNFHTQREQREIAFLKTQLASRLALQTKQKNLLLLVSTRALLNARKPHSP